MYEDITYDVILERMLDRVPDTMDKRESSLIWDTHSPTAIEFQLLYLELENAIQNAYGDTASREYLIERCKERGIRPDEATHAILKGVFVPAYLDVIGKRFNIGDVNYAVLEKIADGEYQVECEAEGEIGNEHLGNMIPIDYIDGLEKAELTEILIPGEEEEDTEVLRERYFASFEVKSFGGNQMDYIEKTNSIAGVGATKVSRAWNGDIVPSNLIPNENVQSWYQGIIGTLSQEVALWLTNLYTAALEKKLTTGGTVLLTIVNSQYEAASTVLINKVQNEIDPLENAGEGSGIAPIGHVVSVKSAVEKEINIKTNIVFDAGFSWSNLQNSINQAISTYLKELRQSWAKSKFLIVRISQIETRILSVQGVIDINSTQLNDIADNLVLGEYEIPMFGGAYEL